MLQPFVGMITLALFMVVGTVFFGGLVRLFLWASGLGKRVRGEDLPPE